MDCRPLLVDFDPHDSGQATGFLSLSHHKIHKLRFWSKLVFDKRNGREGERASRQPDWFHNINYHSPLWVFHHGIVLGGCSLLPWNKLDSPCPDIAENIKILKHANIVKSPSSSLRYPGNWVVLFTWRVFNKFVCFKLMKSHYDNDL